MAKKNSKEVELLPETESIVKRILDESKDELVKNVVDDSIIKMKDEIAKEKDSLKNNLIMEVKDIVKKDQDKVIKRKNFHIFRLKLLILILLAIIGFLFYRLYVTDSIDLLTKDNVCSVSKENKKENKENKEDSKKDLEWYISKYGSLLDNIKITNSNLFTKNSNTKDFDMSQKLVMAYLNLDKDDIQMEDNIYQVSNKVLEEKYNSIFGTDDYKNVSFTVNGLKYAYLSLTDSFISINSDKVEEDSIFTNEIYNIEEKDKTITIYSYLYCVKDSAIFNINNLNKPISKYSKDGISKVVNKLSKVKYVFDLNNNNYYLSSIEYVD